MRSVLYGLLGDTPVPLEPPEWERWMWKEGRPATRVKWTRINSTGVEVSTVFLSIDHGFDGGEPVLWETMVFGPDPGLQQRFTSAAEARAFRKATVTRLRRRLDCRGRRPRQRQGAARVTLRVT